MTKGNNIIEMNLYHGSNKIIKTPEFGKGRIHNDYGRGFYCTEDIEMAREWSCGDEGCAYVNKYSIDMSGLKILHLGGDSDKQCVLQWIAVLLDNRAVKLPEDIMASNARWLISNYAVDLSEYDVVTGYRADDSYFGYARAFTGNALSLEKLSEAMRLGLLGEQIMLKSRNAFDRINFEGAECVDRDIYYGRRVARDLTAREEYNRISRLSATEGTLLADIIRSRI